MPSEEKRPPSGRWPAFASQLIRLASRRRSVQTIKVCIMLLLVVTVILERNAREDRRLRDFFAQHNNRSNVRDQVDRLERQDATAGRLWNLLPRMPLLLTPDALECASDNGSETCRLLEHRPMVHLGYFDPGPLQELAEKTASSRHRRWRLLSNSTESVCVARTSSSSSSPLTVCVSLLEQRKDYWYVGGRNSENGVGEHSWPARAFLNCVIGVVRLKMEATTAAIAVPQPIDQFRRLHRFSRFLECDHRLAAEVRLKYPSMFSGRRVIGLDHADAMAYYRDLLMGLGITPLIFSGTALGWYRECSLLTHTTDIDMSFPAEQYSDVLLTTVAVDPALMLKYQFGRPDEAYELAVLARGIKIDLFALYSQENSSWIGGCKIEERKKIRWVYPLVTEICACDLIGRLFFVPCNVVELLKADFGPNWRIPHHSSSFVWYSSPPNTQYVGYWSEEEWDSVFRRF